MSWRQNSAGNPARRRCSSALSTSPAILVWAERHAVDPSQLSSGYHALIRKITATTLLKIESAELSRLRRASDATAYQNYLLGQHHLRKMDLPDLRRARKAFRAALKEAPHFSSALGGLSRTEHLEWLITARGDNDLIEQSAKHALEAIAADGDDATGYHQLGVAKQYLGAFDESLAAFETAERAAPSHADLIIDYADSLIHASEPEAALDKIARAFEVNPLCPDTYWWTAAGATTHWSATRMRWRISHVADQSHVARFTAACWGMLGDKKQATLYMRKALAQHPDFEIEKWLSIVSIRQAWQRDLYREGLKRAGFR
ncbi:MAG: hypothetical protein QM805_11630 [Pseudomonas sp.]